MGCIVSARGSELQEGGGAMVLDPGFLAQGAELRVDGIELKVENS